VLDLRKAGGFTDFFVICTGGSTRQIVAIADGCATRSSATSVNGRR
jgi:ribosomal silencing factor RsfS